MKFALVTGGMGGIGSAIAKRLAADGYAIAILSRSFVPAFFDGWLGACHKGFAIDVTRSADVERVIEEIEAVAPIDVCVHAATGRIARKKILQLNDSAFREAFEVDVFGGFGVLRAVAARMKKRRRGMLIGLTSIAIEPQAIHGAMGAYVCAKFALRGLLRELSQELKADGVRVNAVAPDFVCTPLHQDLPQRAFELIAESRNGQPLTTPEDVAEAVARVCRAAEGGVTGKTFFVPPDTSTAL